MKKVFLLAAITVVLFVVPKSSSAQENFNLQSQKGHYYFSTTVEGARADIMVESGIPALLVGRSFYENSLKNVGLTFEPSEKEIRLLNNVYKISFRAEGKVRVGNLIFDGPIFVLEDFVGISMPIQYLKMSDGQNAFITLNFQEKTMSVSDKKPKIEGEMFKLHLDKEMGFPVVSSSVEINSEYGTWNLKGDFIVDFGNPELLFLMEQNKNVAKILQDEKIEIIEIINSEYEVIGQTIKAENVTICNRKFASQWVRFTDRMPAIKQLGFIGIPFFEKTVVFDFAGGEMSVQ